MNVIEIKNLNLIIENKSIFKDASLNVADGEYVSIIAANGKGKTSFFKILLGLKIEKSILNYSLKYKEKNVGQTDMEFNNKIAYLGNYNYYDSTSTVYRELMISFKEHETKTIKEKIINQFLDVAQLTKIKHKRLNKCSSGERKLVLIMQILILAIDKEIILLDEPLNNLDSSKIILVNELIRALRHYNSNICIVAITHMPWLTNIDRAFMIDNYKFKEITLDEYYKPQLSNNGDINSDLITSLFAERGI